MSTSSIFTPSINSPGSNTAHVQPAIVTDQDYFMDLSPVENYLFRVPRYHLVKGSETFANMFQSQQTEGSFEGCSAEYPIVLPGVSPVDFRNFLKLVYPQTVVRQASLSKNEWLSVLKLSNLWRFRDLRQMALSELKERDFGHLNSLEKIKVGRECYIPDCLLSGYKEFITRDESITDQEATAMGLLTAFCLCRFRANIIPRTSNAKRRVGENLMEQFLEEFVDLQQRVEEYRPSSGSSNLAEVSPRREVVDSAWSAVRASPHIDW